MAPDASPAAWRTPDRTLGHAWSGSKSGACDLGRWLFLASTLPSMPSAGRLLLCSGTSRVLRRCPTPHGRTCWSYSSSPSPAGPAYCCRTPMGSPGSRAWNFQACLGSLTAQGSRVARVGGHSCCGLPLHGTASAPRTRWISQLNALPACAPVNASPVALRRHAHDSGSGWFATPFL